MPKGNKTNHSNHKYYAHSFKDNFWCKKRVEANITLKEVAELLKCKQSTAGAYFTGFLMPSEEDIKTLCDFFGVDVIEGTREFVNTHKKYDTEQKLTLKYNSRPEKPEKTIRVNEPEEVKPNDTKERDYTEVIKLAYDTHTLSFEEYNQFIDMLMCNYGDPISFVYGKIELKAFKEIERLLEGE